MGLFSCGTCNLGFVVVLWNVSGLVLLFPPSLLCRGRPTRVPTLIFPSPPQPFAWLAYSERRRRRGRTFVNDTLLFPLLYMFALCCCHMHQSGRFGSASTVLLPPSPQSVAWFMLLPTRVACSIARRHTTQAVSALASFAG